MSEQLELEKLKEQIDNLQSIVSRLEKGESKYITPERRLIKERNALFHKYFGTHTELQEILSIDNGYAWRFEEAIKRGIFTTADSLYKIKNGLDTSKQIKIVVNDESKLENYLEICDYCFSMVAKNLFESTGPANEKKD